MSMSQCALRFALSLAAFTASLAYAQAPLGAAFSYQGQFQLDGSPLNDTADFEVTLWDADTLGNPVGSPVAVSNVPVVDGLFTFALDFGTAAFNGQARWLEISVRSPAGGGTFTTLTPRQALTAVPSALFSSAPWTTNGSHISNVNGGNVGIGTNTPADKLSVVGSANFTGNLGIGVSNPSAPLSFGNVLGDLIVLNGMAGGPNFGFGVAPSQLRIHTAVGTQDITFGYGYNGSFTERMRVKGNGSVGIGVSNPGAPLSIAARSDTALQTWCNAGTDPKWNLNLNPFGPAFPSLNFSEHGVNPESLVLREGGNVGISKYPELTLDVVQGGVIGNSTVSLGQHEPSNQGTKVSFGYEVPGTGEFAGMRAVVGPGTSFCGNTGDIRFDTWECGTAPSREVMRIAGNGRVGMGTNAPTHQLTIQGGADSLRLIGPSGAYGYGARLNFGDGNFAYIEESDDDHLTMNATRLWFNADDATVETHYGVSLRTTATAWGLRIFNDAQPAYQAGLMLHHDGFLYLTNRVDQATGYARLDSAGNWTVASDRRSKRDIEPFDGILDKALALQPVSYYYKQQDLKQMPHRQIGFIAQEVEPLFPSLVLGDETKTLNYAGLSVVAIGAVQELKREKDAEIAALRAEKDAQIEELAQRLAKLEALLTERTGN